MPCLDWFEAQDQAYRDSVLPPSVHGAGLGRGRHRDAVVPAGSATPARSSRSSTTVPRADYQTLFREFGFTTEHVVAAARTSLDRVSPRDRVTDNVRPDPHPARGATHGPQREARRAVGGGRVHLARRPVPRAADQRQPAGADHRQAASSGSPPTRRSSRPRWRTGEAYDAQVRELAARGASVDDTVREVTTDDVRTPATCSPATCEHTGGVDGRVSIEVDPRLARDTEATVAEALDLWKIVDRPNLLIKIPATQEGLPAITARWPRGSASTSR